MNVSLNIFFNDLTKQYIFHVYIFLFKYIQNLEENRNQERNFCFQQEVSKNLVP